MAQPPDMMSRFSRLQCAERINAATGWWSLFGDHQVIGKLGKGGGTLAWRHRFTRNSFRPLLRVRFTAIEGGTRVRCRIGVSYFVLGFSVFWCGMVLMFARYTTLPYLLALVSGRQPGLDAVGAFIPLMMLGFFAALNWGGGMLNRNDGPLLLNFVRKKLETAEIYQDQGGI